MVMQSNLTLGQKIKYFREKAGMSQLQLELEAMLAAGSLSRIRRTRQTPPKKRYL